MRRHAVLADTGPLFAVVDPDDQHHERAMREGAKLAADGYSVVAAYPTLFETYTLIHRRLGLVDAHRFLDEMRRRTGLITPTTDDFASACRLPRRYADQHLTVFDCLVAVLSNRLDLPIWTYDRDFDVLGSNVWR